jgi:hypothetical protein
MGDMVPDPDACPGAKGVTGDATFGRKTKYRGRFAPTVLLSVESMGSTG